VFRDVNILQLTVDINIDYFSEKKYPCGMSVLGVKVVIDCWRSFK
jgi:hypothetical protein